MIKIWEIIYLFIIKISHKMFSIYKSCVLKFFFQWIIIEMYFNLTKKLIYKLMYIFEKKFNCVHYWKYNRIKF